MYFDERSHKLATFAAESFGRPGVEGSNFIDQLATSVVRGERWRIHGKGGRSEGTPAPNRLGDRTGSHFEEGVPHQEKAPRFKLQLRQTHTDGVGMELGYGLGFLGLESKNM